MPEEKHLRGAGEKEQRRYEHIKEEAEKEGRYRGREKEVAPGGTVPLPKPVAVSGQEPEELARRQLKRARMSLASRKVETEYLVELGDPAERLLEVADQRDADLIVVGSRERGFLERLLGRSVDEALVRRAERDVLLVH